MTEPRCKVEKSDYWHIILKDMETYLSVISHTEWLPSFTSMVQWSNSSSLYLLPSKPDLLPTKAFNEDSRQLTYLLPFSPIQSFCIMAFQILSHGGNKPYRLDQWRKSPLYGWNATGRLIPLKIHHQPFTTNLCILRLVVIAYKDLLSLNRIS